MVTLQQPHSRHGWGFLFPSLPMLSAALLAVTNDFHARHHVPRAGHTVQDVSTLMAMPCRGCVPAPEDMRRFA